jgi:predicted Zn-dependent protease
MLNRFNTVSKAKNQKGGKGMKTGKNIKELIGIVICFAAVFIGETQYAFADNSADAKLVDAVELSMKGRKLSPEEAKELEKKVSEKPDNLNAVMELLGYYSGRQFKDPNIRQKRHKIILWLIEHHPETVILENPTGGLTPFMDDCKPAIKLWETQVAKHPKNLKILWNAASWLLLIDRNLAEKYLKKGQEIEPENPAWSEKLGLLYSLPGSFRMKDALREYKKAYKNSNPMRANAMLPQLAKTALASGEIKDAEKYARKMLEHTKGASKRKWNYGNLIYYGNFTLGMVALKKGKIEEAEKYLLEAGKTPGSPQLDSFGPNMTLAKELLEKGKKECVIKFLESCSTFWKKDKCDAWIKQIKSDKIPKFGSNIYY